MQPLSYQIQANSCWVTSVLNALLYLHEDKKEISGLVYRLLHSVLTDEGVDTTGDLEIVLNAVGERSKLNIRTVTQGQVQDAIKRLHFNDQVAVCDVNAGQHSIVLLGKHDDGFLAFDPDWDNVTPSSDNVKKFRYFVVGQYATDNGRPEAENYFPRQTGKLAAANLWIAQEHFFAVRRGLPGSFRLGKESTRTLTVIATKRHR